MDREQVTQATAVIQRYRDVELASRIESASPHGLVTLLYERLGQTLDVMARAAAQGDMPVLADQHARATSILVALEAGLDQSAGGNLAPELAAIYARMRRRLLAGRRGDGAAIGDVVEGVRNLATAWQRIAQT